MMMPGRGRVSGGRWRGGAGVRVCGRRRDALRLGGGGGRGAPRPGRADSEGRLGGSGFGIVSDPPPLPARAMCSGPPRKVFAGPGPGPSSRRLRSRFKTELRGGLGGERRCRDPEPGPAPGRVSGSLRLSGSCPSPSTPRSCWAIAMSAASSQRLGDSGRTPPTCFWVAAFRVRRYGAYDARACQRGRACRRRQPATTAARRSPGVRSGLEPGGGWGGAILAAVET